MTAQREALFTCTYQSPDEEITAVIRAWSEEQALAEFERELGRHPADLRGRVSVERRSGRSTRRGRMPLDRSPQPHRWHHG